MFLSEVKPGAIKELVKELWLPLALLAGRICSFVFPKLEEFGREILLALHGLWCAWRAAVRKWRQTEELERLANLKQVAYSTLQKEEETHNALLFERSQAEQERNSARLAARSVSTDVDPHAQGSPDVISITLASFNESLGYVVSQKGYESERVALLPGLMAQLRSLGGQIRTFSAAELLYKQVREGKQAPPEIRTQ